KPIFIFDQDILDKLDNPQDRRVAFIHNILSNIKDKLRSEGSDLFVYYGKPLEIWETLLKSGNVQNVYSNKDYEPYALQRDQEIAELCANYGSSFHQFKDQVIFECSEVVKDDGKPYTVFTPFFNNAARLPVAAPRLNRHTNYLTKHIAQHTEKTFIPTPNHDLFATGGSSAAHALLKRMSSFAQYEHERNLPAHAGTTGLSAHLKFGTCSVREVFHAIAEGLGTHHPLLRQLYWRDFFSHIAYHFPHVFGHAFHEEYDHIKWPGNLKLFHAWCTGNTGFPLVDAGMRQLNATGWMHNRVRMVVASFLVKDLLLDWRLGEQYFATKLVDYDPAVNNGNWQWAASTGCDAQPYFRIFNPWLQQKTYDPDCAYIKHWVPELRNLASPQIHAWHRTAAPSAGRYPKPIVQHEVAILLILSLLF
ncbi:deoxyribodipyrimidine photo-lyase, partial [bacterium]|nr:deoxyribodipyrimidine photo-lyase [bacterium]